MWPLLADGGLDWTSTLSKNMYIFNEHSVRERYFGSDIAGSFVWAVEGLGGGGESEWKGGEATGARPSPCPL